MTLEDRLKAGAHSLTELSLQVEVDPSAPKKRNTRRNRALAGLAGLVLLAGAGLGGALLLRDQPDVNDEVNTEVDEDQPAPDADVEAVEDADAVSTLDLAATIPAGPRDGAGSFRFPIEVVPGANLVDGDTVTVRGRGFSPNAQVGMVQCWIDGGDGNIDSCDIASPNLFSTNSSGGFEQTITVRRYIEVQGERVDCAEQTLTARCVLGAGELSNYDRSGAAILHFASDDQPAAPTLAVSTTTNLTHGQVVDVSGSGFPPGAAVELHQCVLGGFDTEDVCGQITATWQVNADDNGTFETGVSVNRTVQSVDGVVDCAEASCYVFARSIPPSQPVALSFDPSDDVPAGQVVGAAGNSVLRDGQTIRIDGEAMLVDGDVRVLQCTQSGYCEDIGETAVANGTTSVTVPVKRILWQPGQGAHDCANERCDVVGWMSGVKVWTIELDFDTSVPPPPGPELLVTPNEALVDGQAVSLAVSGLDDTAADYGFWFRQCTTNQAACVENYGFESVIPDSPTQQFVVQRLIWDYTTRRAVDCAEVECRIYVDAAGTPVSTRLNFDPTVPAPSLPSLTVTPNTNLVDGQEVTVTGSNLSGGLSLCGTTPSSGPICNSVPFGFESETAMTATVYRSFTSYEGERIDCAETPCTLESWNGDGFPLIAELNFDATLPLRPAAEVALTDGPYEHGQELVLELINFRGLNPNRTPAIVIESADGTVGDDGDSENGVATAVAGPPVAISICTASGSSCSEALVLDQSNDGLQVTVVAWQLLPDFRPQPSGTDSPAQPQWIDCAQLNCVMTVRTTVDQVSVALPFDPNAPAPAPPTVVVNADGLGQGPVELGITVINHPIEDGWWADVCANEWCVNSSVPGEPVTLTTTQSADCAADGCTVHLFHETWQSYLPPTVFGGQN